MRTVKKSINESSTKRGNGRPSKKRKAVTDASLLKLLGNICKERANFRCEYPDCDVRSSQLHPHHFYSRRNASIRYDPDNIIVLCPIHHTLGSFSAHNDPDFKDRIIATCVRSQDWNEKLRLKRNLIVKNNQAFKDAALKKLMGMFEFVDEML